MSVGSSSPMSRALCPSRPRARVCWIDEMRCLASAAVHFTYTGDPPWTLPTRDEARRFVDDYVAARGVPLGRAELTRLDAAAIDACSP